MTIVETNVLTPIQLEQLYKLWNAEYPVKITFSQLSNFEMYLGILEDINHFLLYNDQNCIRGWAYSFNRENERWFAVFIAENWQTQGFGTVLLNKLKATEPELSGWVVDHDDDVKRSGKPYLSPLAFFKKKSFNVLSKTRLELRELSAVKICWSRK